MRVQFYLWDLPFDREFVPDITYDFVSFFSRYCGVERAMVDVIQVRQGPQQTEQVRKAGQVVSSKQVASTVIEFESHCK
jgi:hypothetical protein